PSTAFYPLSLHDALPIWILPAVDVSVDRIDDALTVPANHRVGILPERFGHFAVVVTARPDANDPLSLLVRVLDLPVDPVAAFRRDRKSTRLNSSHVKISY